ncbi:MAG: nitroreductase family protein [Bacilli bacterium]
MNKIEAINNRHSVRQYLEKPIDDETIKELKKEIDLCNQESGLHIQLVLNEPKAFDCFMAHYGKFSGVKNYIALIGKKGKLLDELCGYYGERIVIKATQLGLNTCWVAMSYKKIPSAFVIDKGEKLVVVIALGYGTTNGVMHKSKTIDQVSNASEETPDWFNQGVELALLAPTAMNQQKFKIIYDQNTVTFKSGVGFYSKVDLGIIKYHFEVGSSKRIYK